MQILVFPAVHVAHAVLLHITQDVPANEVGGAHLVQVVAVPLHSRHV